MTRSSEFWDALAPHHAALENSYFDLASLRRILRQIHPPVLVVGAGQGLIVAELQGRGIQCDGVDLSPEMIRLARIRRGLELIHADARAMPFGNGDYRTIIYATGVIDFMGDEEAIQVILNEGRRIAAPAGSILVAFYRLSAATEDLMLRLGLIQNNLLRFRETLEVYRLILICNQSNINVRLGCVCDLEPKSPRRRWRPFAGPCWKLPANPPFNDCNASGCGPKRGWAPKPSR